MSTAPTAHSEGDTDDSDENSDTRHVTCFVCDEVILPGEAREATTTATGRGVTRHWACGEMRTGPPGVIGGVTAGDIFEVRFLDVDPDTWHYASVEGSAMCGQEYTVRAVLQDVLYAEERKDTPFNYTDQFDIVTTPRGNTWTEPDAFEVEPDWPAIENGPGRSFEYNHHVIGPVELRPTDLTAQHDWEFWNTRPTDPVDLYERYEKHGESTTEIADDLGVSGWTVRNWMDRAGINRRSPD